jgi:hypothetical protein
MAKRPPRGGSPSSGGGRGTRRLPDERALGAIDWNRGAIGWETPPEEQSAPPPPQTAGRDPHSVRGFCNKRLRPGSPSTDSFVVSVENCS